MTNKLKFLTKISLNKKIKTKWFLIANLLFAILIIGLLNIDYVIKIFGGDFEETQEILVIDEVGVFDNFKVYYEENAKYVTDYVDTEIIKYTARAEITNLSGQRSAIIIGVITNSAHIFVTAPDKTL